MPSNKIYNKHLMYRFLEGFRSYSKKQDGQLAENLLRPFLRGEVKNDENARAWTNFYRYCRHLTEMEDFGGIIRFMYAVFDRPEEYDLPEFYKILSSVSIGEKDNLATLCQDFYKHIHKTEAKKLQKDIPSDVLYADLYHDDYSILIDKNTILLPDIVTVTPVFLSKRIYGLSLESPFKKDDVDTIAAASIKIRQRKFEAQIEEIKLRNLKAEAREAELNLGAVLTRGVEPNFTAFDYNSGVAGALLPIFRAAELKGENELCYYILQKHIWPLFSETPWFSENNKFVCHMAQLVESYADSMFALVTKVDITPFLSDVDLLLYSEKDLRKELLKGDGKIIKIGKERFSSYGELGLLMDKTFRKGRNLLREAMQPYLYSHLLALIPYILYSSNHKEEASSFYVDFYYEISDSDRRSFWVQIPLVRSILETEQIGVANILYGCYAYEMDRAQRDMSDMRKEFLEMTDFLLASKSYIFKARRHSFDTKRSWYDILFEDGRIDSVINKVRALCLNGSIPDYSDFRELFRIAAAFSYPYGIQLHPLKIDNQDNYDKLDGAISSRLQEWGYGLTERLSVYRLFYQSLRLYDLRKMVNAFALDHIEALAVSQVQDTLNEIAKMKTAIEAGTEEEKEQLLIQIDDVVEKLVIKLQSAQSRREVERDILKLQEKFLKTYLPEEIGTDLLSSLPSHMRNTVLDYIVTSEVVYRSLSSHPDRDSLDFSPALITLTKAIEMILHCIYSSMNIQRHADLDSKIDSNIFDKNGQQKAALEFGPYIMLLKDYRYVKKDRGGRGIFINSRDKYDYSHFTEWGGYDVVDIEKLKKFSQIEIKVQTKNNSTLETYTVNFNEDSSANREILALGLQYIKDNYRNVVAHKDPVSRTSVDDCKELLLETQNLLWILLSIIRQSN